MKTSGKEYFYLISGLVVPKYMVSDTFVKQLDDFSLTANDKTKKIKECLDNNNIPMFVTEMENLYTILCDIRADWLEAEAARILRLVDINYRQLYEKLIAPFVENVRMLIVEIQMARIRAEEGSTNHHQDELDRYKSILNDLKVIATLMANSEFDKAFDLAITIDGLQESEYGRQFINCIVLQNTTDFAKKTTDLTAYYMVKIEKHTKTAVDVLKKVLIVDDQPEILMSVSRMLNKQYQVFALPDGEQALNFLKKHRVEAFILDIDMPKMNGFELAGRIKQKDEYERAPILFLTSNVAKETIMKAPLYGAKGFIAKPVNKEVILSKLDSLLQS